MSKIRRHIGESKALLATIAGRKDILVRNVLKVSLLSLLFIMINICLGRIEIAMCLLDVLVHLKLFLGPFGCPNLL